MSNFLTKPIRLQKNSVLYIYILLYTSVYTLEGQSMPLSPDLKTGVPETCSMHDIIGHLQCLSQFEKLENHDFQNSYIWIISRKLDYQSEQSIFGYSMIIKLKNNLSFGKSSEVKPNQDSNDSYQTWEIDLGSPGSPELVFNHLQSRCCKIRNPHTIKQCAFHEFHPTNT